MRKTLNNLRVFAATSYVTVQLTEQQDGTGKSVQYAVNPSPETRVAFVPAGQNSVQSEVRLVTQDMMRVQAKERQRRPLGWSRQLLRVVSPTVDV